jgi:uncharacterized protein
MPSPSPTIRALYRYPVKGLSPEALARVELSKGATVPFDRAYAIENGPGRFDPEQPKYLPKINFLMLMRDERLASLETHFDDANETLTIKRSGKQVARGQLSTPTGRQLIEQFMAAYMQGAVRGAPKVVHAQGHSFSDVSAKCLHIINLASVRELERVAGRPMHPLRFRANVHIDGIPPWEELSWVGKTLTLGAASLRVLDRTTRCEATNVDPTAGVRDMAIPSLLQRTWGHTDFGIYAKVTVGGSITIGDAVAAQ